MSKTSEIQDILDRIDRKLGFFIGEKIKDKNLKIRDQIHELKPLTTDYKEIGRILGISSSHAAMELSKLKKGKKK